MNVALKCLFVVLLFSACNLFASNTDNMLLIKAPNFCDVKSKQYRVGLRPYRSSGIRVEKEKIGDKNIIHNYGHGGAGISLSFGSVLLASELLEGVSVDQEIGIIGAGVIGLTTAVRLRDLGYRVHIYAKDLTPNTTSDVAGGLWAPFCVAQGDTQQEKINFESMMKNSREYFYALATSENPRFLGVSLVKGYALHHEPQGKAIQVKFDTGKSMWAVIEETIMIDTGVYLASLMNELEKKGVVIQHVVKLVSRDILALEQKIIFNCSGLGATELFKDEKLVPIRGHLIQFKAQEGVNYYAHLASKPHSKYFTCLFPHKDRILIGGSFEEDEVYDEVNNEICETILKQAIEVFGNS